MGKLEELLYEIVAGILGLVIMVSFAATAYAHLWLQNSQGPLRDVAATFSEDVQAEVQLMNDVRLIGLILSISLVCILALFSIKYYRLKDDPAWELKKGVAGGFFCVIAGSFFFVISGELFPQAIGASLLALGLISIVGNTISLLLGPEQFLQATS